LRPRQQPQVQARLGGLTAAVDAVGNFARVTGPTALEFPRDHGPHLDYQTEWWYYTGNLEATDGRRFGYQLTFFRRALASPEERSTRASRWATDQIYMAHLAVSDISGNGYQAFERFSRGAAGLAGAQSSPFQVWLTDWRVEAVAADVYRLHATQEGLELDLRLRDEKGPVLQGDEGFSPKGPQAGNASVYYSLTRLITSGHVRIDGRLYEVAGLSWMDHEYSTSALAPNQVGWDWFAFHLDDGSELMLFQIRQADGSIDPFSSGTVVAAEGTTRQLSRADFEIQVTDTWVSPHSGASYPSSWIVTIPALELALTVTPYLADQELNVSYTYWEGAVRVTSQRASGSVGGEGYVELTGYAGSMQDQF
jgi:predicted secreted hydrolase